jgi:plastocyanin
MPDRVVRRCLALATTGLLLAVLGSCATLQAGGTATASPSPDPSARCELDAAASPAATIPIHNRVYGPEVTVKAGESVAFSSQDNTTHTVTEGVGGHGAENACARQRLPPFGGTLVTFHLPGGYRFTCTIHATMQTTVHVR